MYKMFIIFIFFTSLSLGQTVPPHINQSNSVNEEKETIRQSKAKSVDSKALQTHQLILQKSINELYSSLNTVSLSTFRKTPTLKEQKALEQQLKKIEKLDNESFEYHLFKYKLGNYDFSKIKHLEAAAQINPSHQEVIKEMSAYAFINQDEKQLKRYLAKYSHLLIQNNDLNVFAKSLLISLPKNTFLITHGENDTYPLLIAQHLKMLRQDVEIISLDHLQSKDFRKQLKKKGLKMPKSTVIDTSFFKTFIQFNKTENIVAAPSVPHFYLQKGENLSNIGLGYGFYKNENQQSNLSVYESTLKQQIMNHVSSCNKITPILSNYLPFLFEVRNQYIEINNLKAKEEVELLILKIAQLSNKTTQVKALLNK